MHTKWSDGGGTISEMAAAAIDCYKFIAITDHTQGLKIAGGLEIYAREPLENETATNREPSRPGRRDAVVSCYLRQG